jgi:hypothetical protein
MQNARTSVAAAVAETIHRIRLSHPLSPRF